jgi:cellulose synthase operon protein YhjQ
MPLICVSSPKGGVGKTTIAANLASRLVATGLRVIAIDLDPQNSLRIHFGMPFGDRGGFMCMLPDLPDWRRALLSTPSGVRLLPYGRQRLGEAMTASACLADNPELIARPVREMLDHPETVVIVDSAPGMSPQLMALLPLSDLVLTVLLADPISLSQIPGVEDGDTYGQVADLSCPDHGTRIGFVLNQLDLRSRIGPALIRSARTYLGERLLGTVFRDENVPEAAAAQRSIASYSKHSKAARDIDDIARIIAGRFRDSLAGTRIGAVA